MLIALLNIGRVWDYGPRNCGVVRQLRLGVRVMWSAAGS
jgi:hypothetical protein